MRNPGRQARRIVRGWRRDAVAGGWLDMDQERLDLADRFLAGDRTEDGAEAVNGIVSDWYANAMDDNDSRLWSGYHRSSTEVQEWVLAQLAP